MADVAANTDEKKTGDNAIDAENAVSINDQNSAKLVKADTDNVDDAYAAVQAHGDVVVDAATDKRLLRKIDRYILPIMCLVYGMYAWICEQNSMQQNASLRYLGITWTRPLCRIPVSWASPKTSIFKGTTISGLVPSFTLAIL